MIDFLFEVFYGFIASPFFLPFMGLSFISMTFFTVNLLLFRGFDR